MFLGESRNFPLELSGAQSGRRTGGVAPGVRYDRWCCCGLTLGVLADDVLCRELGL
jgi:hypothetical protein